MMKLECPFVFNIKNPILKTRKKRNITYFQNLQLVFDDKDKPCYKFHTNKREQTNIELR